MIVTNTTGTFAGPQAALWTAAFVTYGAALAVCLHRGRRELDPAVRAALGAVLSVAGLAIVHLSGDAITAATLQQPLAGAGLALERINDRVRVTRYR